MLIFFKMILTGMKRRKREIRFVSIAVFIAVFSMVSVSLFQSVMNKYMRELNYHNYGEWILSAVGRNIDHPYLSAVGRCDTGAAILKENGEMTGMYLGSVDDSFREIGHITFYEGRMPESENEIVMTLSALAKMGYSYEVGQTIHVSAFRDEKFFEQDFVLVGTIKNFAGTWMHAGNFPLPSCIVTKEALAATGGIDHTTNFFQLNRKYEDIDIGEFIEPYFREVSEFFPLTYNSYAYGSQMWGSPEMFQNIQNLLILIAVLVISYLMMSYVTKRRKWYYQMRCTGASRGQIWIFILLEGGYSVIPWAVSALALPYAAVAGICFVIAERVQMNNFFEMDMALLWRQAASVVGIILAALLIACLSSGDRRLGSNVHEVTKRQLKRLKRVAKRRRNTARSFQKRQNRLHPFQRMAMAVLSIVVCSIMLLCIHQLYKEYLEYSFTMNIMNDFSGHKSGKLYHEAIYLYEDENGEMQEGISGAGGSSHLMYVGMSPEMVEQIEQMEGIKEVDKYTWDTEHYLIWDGCEESPIFQHFEHVKKIQRIIEGNPMDNEVACITYVYEDYKEALENMGSIIKNHQVDEEAFRNGDQILILLKKANYVDYEDKYLSRTIILEETTLQSGEIVTMVSTNRPGKVSAEAVVVTLTEERIEESHGETSWFWYGDPYTVVASTAFAERLAEADGEQFQYNEIEINFTRTTSFSATVKALAAIFEEEGFVYGPSWEEREIAHEEFIHSICSYGVVLVVILSVYLILWMNVNQMKNFERAQKYRLLKRLGMSDWFFIKMNIKDSFKSAIWLIFGIPISYGLVLIMEWLPLRNEEYLYVYSTYLKKYTYKPFWCAVEYARQNTSEVHTTVFVILLMAAVISIGCLSARAAMKKEERI